MSAAWTLPWRRVSHFVRRALDKDTVCGRAITAGAYIVWTNTLRDVTCKRCLRRLAVKP